MSFELQKMDPVRSNNTNLRSTDRIFKLQVIDDELPKNSTGLIDRNLFSGKNKLHAVRDPQTILWSVKYEFGMIPSALDQRFTSFTKLVKYLEEYFQRRNIKIVEILD